MTVGQTLRALTEQARDLATGELEQPSLYSVLVDLAPSTSVPRARHLRFGFQQLKRGLVSEATLKACWVEWRAESQTLTVISAGTCGHRQFRELAAMRGVEFPPPTLDLARLRLEIADVLAILQHASPFGEIMGSVDLGLCVHDGRLAWRVLQEVSDAGFRTLLVAADDGQVLYDKVDWRHAPQSG
jgi:hypothetical protein